MKKIGILWLTSLLLWACLDSNDLGGTITISGTDDSDSTELSSSDIQSSSSSKPNEDKSCSSSTIKSSSSSSVNKKISSSSELTSSSSKDSKSSSSNSESSSSSSESNSSSSESSSSSIESSSSSSKPSSSAQSSSSLELIATEISPIRIQSLGISPNADFSVFVLSGIAYIDVSDTAAISDSESAPFFTKVDFFLVHVNEHGQNEGSLLQVQYTPLTGPTAAISFEEQGAKIIDSAKAQCGTFKLFVIVKASNDLAIEDMFITIDSVEFVRDPIHCPEPGSSSSTIEQVELIQYNGQMKTSTTNGYSFKKGAEVPLKDAQIQVTMDELTGRLTLHGVNGYKVTKYSNNQDHEYDDD